MDKSYDHAKIRKALTSFRKPLSISFSFGIVEVVSYALAPVKGFLLLRESPIDGCPFGQLGNTELIVDSGLADHQVRVKFRTTSRVTEMPCLLGKSS